MAARNIHGISLYLTSFASPREVRRDAIVSARLIRLHCDCANEKELVKHSAIVWLRLCCFGDVCGQEHSLFFFVLFFIFIIIMGKSSVCGPLPSPPHFSPKCLRCHCCYKNATWLCIFRITKHLREMR